MTRTILLAMVVALAAPAMAAAQDARPGQRAERREQLERQVRERFLDIAAERLDLSADQRERLGAVVHEGMRERRALMRESMELRRRLLQAARDDATTAETFESLLARLDSLAAAEHALERREQERLAAFLSPRQRALFLVERMRFNERVRELRGRGPGARRPGGPGR